MFFELFGKEFHLVITSKYIQFIFRYEAEKITKFLHKEKKSVTFIQGYIISTKFIRLLQDEYYY